MSRLWIGRRAVSGAVAFQPTAARSSLTSAGSRITYVSYALAVTRKSAAHVQLQMATAILAHKSINPEAALYLTL
jgi:hypothetical protein